MRNTKSLIIIAALLIVVPAFAEDNKQLDPKIVQLQVKQAISLLLNAGVLNIYENEKLIERVSILEELAGRGRVQTLGAAQSSICGKQK